MRLGSMSRMLRLLCLAAVGGALFLHGAKAAQAPLAAPDFSGADSWLNTAGKTVSLKDLKGQVVLLDFWTYCCINCMHIFPDLHTLEEKYKDQPLVVIGVHSGKFDEEKDVDHIRQAILRHNINHPVAVDSQYKIWNAYGVPGWPTLVLIDTEGNVAGAWSGEGHRDQIDARINDLLKAARQKGSLAKPVRFTPERATFKPGVLEFPGKVLADATRGRLFISDTNHNRVLVADLAGKVTQVVGSGAGGLKDGAFKDAELHQPQGLALSADGKTLYVADTENHALRAADLVNGTLVTIAGTGQQARRVPENAPAKMTALSSPWDLARAGESLYIAMAGVHQIWVMDLKNNTVRVVAGTGREGAVDGANAEAGFAQPSGLATDGEKLFVADSEVSSIRGVGLGAAGATHTLAGSGDLFGFGRADGIGKAARFQHPLGVALDEKTLYVADTFNGLIRKIDLKSGNVSTIAGTGATDPGSAESPNFYEPGGLSLAGNVLYVADTNHHRILATDFTTRKSTVISIRLP
jgi:DNA-binding beta-propeller fold protein YncE/peroxiredoxin